MPFFLNFISEKGPRAVRFISPGAIISDNSIKSLYDEHSSVMVIDLERDLRDPLALKLLNIKPISNPIISNLSGREKEFLKIFG